MRRIFIVMPKSRGRKPKKAPRKGSGSRGSGGAPTTARLRMSDDKIIGLLGNDQIAPDLRIMLLLPILFLSRFRGYPGNICVDACMTLRHAFGQFGIAAELRAVQLVIRKPSGQLIQRSGPEPSWDGAQLAGHCVLWLPETGRLIDPTVEQFPEIARYKRGPVVGRTGGTGGLPAGAHFEVPRGDLALLYTVLDGKHTATIVNAPRVSSQSDEIRRMGINIASWAVVCLRRLPHCIDQVRPSFPRLSALLDAVADAPAEVAEDKNWRFTIDGPGDTARLLLDEIPLPPGTPGDPAADDPAVITAAGNWPMRGWQPPSKFTPRLLADGIGGPGGVSLRLARPGETADVGHLLRHADARLTADVAASVEDGTIGSTLLNGLISGQDEMIQELVIAAHGRDPEAAMPGLSAVLVAETPSRALAGAIEARPPSWIFADAANAGVPLPQALLGTLTVIKICGVAVAEPFRRSGIGAALINACTGLYFQLGYLLAYGEFDCRADLAPYYTQLGFDVHPAGAAISLDERLGLPVGIATMPGERLFARWR